MADGELLHGQLLERGTGRVTPFTEQQLDKESADALVGTANTEITPTDAAASLVRTFVPPLEWFNETVISYPGNTNLDLPDRLTSLAVTYNINGGDGGHIETGTGVSAGTHSSLSLSFPSRAQSSASIVPELLWTIVPTPARNVPCLHYVFYMPGNPTRADLLTALSAIVGATVLDLPAFDPKPLVFLLRGQQVSVSADASAQQHKSISDSNVTMTYSTGVGGSKEAGVSTRTVTLPPTSHGALSVTGSSYFSSTATATARANIGAGTNWEARDSGLVTKTATATGSISPTSITSTAVNSIPTSGLYLTGLAIEPDDYEFVRIHAEVVDFAFFL